MSDENGYATQEDFARERQQAADFASQKMTENYHLGQQRTQEAEAQTRQVQEDARRSARFPQGPTGRTTSPVAQKTGPSLLYKIFIIGAAWLILYYTGLTHTAFATVPNLLKATAIAGSAIFLLTQKGRNFAMIAFARFFLGVIGMFVLAMAGEKMGFLSKSHRLPPIEPLCV